MNALYEILVALTWRYVLTTRKELETVSETTDAQKPITAWRNSIWSVEWGSGRLSLRRL